MKQTLVVLSIASAWLESIGRSIPVTGRDDARYLDFLFSLWLSPDRRTNRFIRFQEKIKRRAPLRYTSERRAALSLPNSACNYFPPGECLREEGKCERHFKMHNISFSCCLLQRTFKFNTEWRLHEKVKISQTCSSPLIQTQFILLRQKRLGQEDKLPGEVASHCSFLHCFNRNKINISFAFTVKHDSVKQHFPSTRSRDTHVTRQNKGETRR